MNCPDLKAYVLGETDRTEREEIRSHLAVCDACRLEAERLRVTTTALRMLPDEEIPVHVRFVSDKVFEPWWRRWRLMPSGAFAAALLAVLLIVEASRLLPQRPQPPASSQAVATLTSAEIQTRINQAVDARVKSEVSLVAAQMERRNDEHTLAMLADFRQKSQTDRQRLIQAVETEYQSVDQKVNQAVFAANEKLPVLNQ
ncbi:MAG TPA: zf-HC2 domain-containing protein [Bryobacteraceae bacterium]|jgi:anti-sigma factor RsiW|nr:zf-HC2 domain-containing protein [Bryobacteraceae bacterium]